MPEISDLQLALDLWHYPLRGREQAEHIISTQAPLTLMNLSRYERALRRIIFELRPYLDEIVIIGGWVPYLYKRFGGFDSWNAPGQRFPGRGANPRQWTPGCSMTSAP